MAATTRLSVILITLLLASGVDAARFKRTNNAHRSSKVRRRVEPTTAADTDAEKMSEEIRTNVLERRRLECEKECPDSSSETCVDDCMGDKPDIDIDKLKKLVKSIMKKLAEVRALECQAECPDGSADDCMEVCIAKKPNRGSGDKLISMLKARQAEECQEECPSGSPDGCADDCLGHHLVTHQEIVKKLFQEETMENIMDVIKDCQKKCEGEGCTEDVQGCVDYIPDQLANGLGPFGSGSDNGSGSGGGSSSGTDSGSGEAIGSGGGSGSDVDEDGSGPSSGSGDSSRSGEGSGSDVDDTGSGSGSAETSGSGEGSGAGEVTSDSGSGSAESSGSGGGSDSGEVSSGSGSGGGSSKGSGSGGKPKHGAQGKHAKPKQNSKHDFRKTPKTGKVKVRRAMKFNGNYDQVVGDRKADFLIECTAKQPPGVSCTDVRKESTTGSIIVDTTGPAEDVEAEMSKFASAGKLSLPSFEAGDVVEEVEPDLTDIAEQGIVVGEEDEPETKAMQSSSPNRSVGVLAGFASLLLGASNLVW